MMNMQRCPQCGRRRKTAHENRNDTGVPQPSPWCRPPATPPARASEAMIQICQACGGLEDDYTLAEVDIGVGIQTHLCDDPFHDEAKERRRRR